MYMLHLFMKEKSPSNVIFVTTVFLERANWNNMLHLFMKAISHSNVTSVNTAVLKSSIWSYMFQKSMKENNNNIDVWSSKFYFVHKLENTYCSKSPSSGTWQTLYSLRILGSTKDVKTFFQFFWPSHNILTLLNGFKDNLKL